mgnify:CR=1 FL=1
MVTIPAKNMDNMLIFVILTVKLKISPLNPEANSLTISSVNKNTNKTIIAHNTSTMFIRLLVKRLASAVP